MPSFAAMHLSGSTSGRPIKIAATAIASGTTVHTAVAGATGFDEITLYVTNTDTVARDLTIGWGGTTDPDDLIMKTVSVLALAGPIPIVTRQRLNGGLVVKGAGSVANVLLVSGNVDRIS